MDNCPGATTKYLATSGYIKYKISWTLAAVQILGGRKCFQLSFVPFSTWRHHCRRSRNKWLIKTLSVSSPSTQSILNTTTCVVQTCPHPGLLIIPSCHRQPSFVTCCQSLRRTRQKPMFKLCRQPQAFCRVKYSVAVELGLISLLRCRPRDGDMVTGQSSRHRCWCPHLSCHQIPDCHSAQFCSSRIRGQRNNLGGR